MFVRTGLVALATLAMACAGCLLQAPLTPARCDEQRECVDGYTCVDGWCADDASVRDAGPRAEDAGEGDGGGVDPDAGAGSDAGASDAGTSDAGEDAGQDDAGPVDAGSVDAGPVDGGSVDAGPVDGGPLDAGPVDGGPPDAGPADAGVDGGCPLVPSVGGLQNLLGPVNPCFSEPSPATLGPRHWNRASENIVWDDAVFRSAPAAARVFNPLPDAGPRYYTYPRIDQQCDDGIEFEVGATYRFRAHALVEGEGRGVHLWAGVECGQLPNQCFTEWQGATDGGWVELSLEFSVPDGGVATLGDCAGLRVQWDFPVDGGQGWLDDLSLVKLP